MMITDWVVAYYEWSFNNWQWLLPLSLILTALIYYFDNKLNGNL